jgi:hypothetical protein
MGTGGCRSRPAGSSLDIDLVGLLSPSDGDGDSPEHGIFSLPSSPSQSRGQDHEAEPRTSPHEPPSASQLLQLRGVLLSLRAIPASARRTTSELGGSGCAAAVYHGEGVMPHVVLMDASGALTLHVAVCGVPPVVLRSVPTIVFSPRSFSARFLFLKADMKKINGVQF